MASADVEVFCLGVAWWMDQPERVEVRGVAERSYGIDAEEDPHREPSQDVMVAFAVGEVGNLFLAHKMWTHSST